MDFIKYETFTLQKISLKNKCASHWLRENIYKTHVWLNRDFCPGYIKNLYNTVTRKQTTCFFFFKWAKDVKRHLAKENIYDVKQAHEKMFNTSHWWWWFSHSVVSDSCDPMDCSPPGSSVHGSLQARTLDWGAISFSRGSSWPRDQTPSLLHCREILYQLSWGKPPQVIKWMQIKASWDASTTH